MQHQYIQQIDLSNTPTMEEVLNGRYRSGQRTFFSSENHVLREKPSSNKRDKIYRESRLSTQQVTLQTFQWLSPEILQEHRPVENYIKFQNESSVVSMDEIYKRNNVDDLSKKLYTIPYSFHHNTFPEEHQFSENQFPCLENDIQSTLCIDENDDVTNKSKDHMTNIFPISINERNKNVIEDKVLANNIKYTNKTGIFDSEYRIKKEKLTEKQQRSVKESLAAESLMTLQISKDDEDDILLSSKDQMKQNKRIKKKVQNHNDKENDQKLNSKNIINDQILYDMIVRSGMTMENILKLREDHYKNTKNDIRNTVLHPAKIPLQSQPPTTVNMPVQLQAPIPVPNPFQSPAPIVNSMPVVKLPKTKPANMSGYRTRPVPILPATNLPYHPYLIQSELELNTEMNGILQEKPQRPSYSYASMIGQAIMASEEKKLALADIYSWISKTYPYYKMSDIGWKNSIRHNLSLYSAFIRVPNEGTTRSLWMINPDEEQCFINGVYHYSKRPPGSNKSLRRKSKTVPKTINENSNNVKNVQTERSQVPAYLTTNDTIIPMATSLPYCSMHPEGQYFSTYELPKDEVTSEQSY
ncbi:7638_t:CDS:2, partial [Funneliformis mosseae]